MFILPRNYSFVNDMTALMLRARPMPGNTVKQAEINRAEYNGKIEGCLVGLAALANQERVAAMKPITSQLSEDLFRTKVGWIPGVASYDTRSWWNDIKAARDNGEFKDLSDEEFSKVIAETWHNKIVWNEEFSFYHKGARKWAVMSGVIPPSPEDKEWIIEEYDTMKKALSPYANLLESITKAERME